MTARTALRRRAVWAGKPWMKFSFRTLANELNFERTRTLLEGSCDGYGRMPGARQEGVRRGRYGLSAGQPVLRGVGRAVARERPRQIRGGDRRAFYAEGIGCPSLAPGVYFWMLMGGMPEGIVSERGLAWQCRYSMSRRELRRCGLANTSPEAFHAVEHAQAAEAGGSRGGVHVGAGAAAGFRAAGRHDGGVGLDDAEGERSDARHRAEGRRDGVRGVARGSRASVGDRHADAGEPCEAGPQASGEGIQQGLDASVRPQGADHEDEGRDAPGARARGGGGHGDQRGWRDGANDARRRHRLAGRDAGRNGAAAGGSGDGAEGGGRVRQPPASPGQS